MTTRHMNFATDFLPARSRQAVPPWQRQAGISLLEVLITLVVLTIGLLGLAGLQTVSLQLNQGALVRSQTSNLAYDITERIRANWSAAAAYGLAIDDDAESSPSTLAARDLSEWRNALAATLPEGTGSVDVTGNRVTVVIRWLDAGDDGTEFARDTERLFEFRTDL